MGRGAWYVLVDEDIEPRVVEHLRTEGVRAAHVPDVLYHGADDEADILPYARDNGAIIVTSNWRDFARFDPDDHCGCIIEFGQNESATEIATAVLAAIDQYGDPAEMKGWDKLEYWLRQA